MSVLCLLLSPSLPPLPAAACASFAALLTGRLAHLLASLLPLPLTLLLLLLLQAPRLTCRWR